ncbi:Protein of unknown function [Roseovarius lutimaris]|uniref:DUF3307 domain-containing protein n=1 Tax=Roseovarius lutimaris TaxID=1005928 RepID=A0A1I5AQN6_9RHOB|nr:DUF3307 domain-containing protein [Roseovarius lutimaris]SFN64743.1 Protein of unknown function [Roseovarius lutimaris]
MTTNLDLIAVLILFQIKHFIGDYLWQTGWMLANNGRYGHPGGLAHAGLHGTLSAPILIWAGVPIAATLMLALAEAVLHYHIDWSKARTVRRHHLDETQPAFWRYLGLDQGAHQLTYIALFAAALSL